MKIINFYSLITAILAALMLHTSAIAQSGEYAVRHIPESLKKNADEVYRLDYMKLDIEDSKSMTVHLKKVVTLLNSNSREAVQGVSYDRKNTKIKKLSAKVYDAAGREVKSYKSRDFMDKSAISSFSIYEDDRVKIIELNHNSYPYTIEFEYEVLQKKLPFYPAGYLQSFGKSVEKFKYIVQTRKDFEIKYKALNTDLQPVITEGNSNIVYQWSDQNLPALPIESFAPYPDQIRPVIKIAPLEFQYDNYKGSMADWKSFGHFIYRLNAGRDELSHMMTEKVQSLISNTKNDREKIEVLYRYLQENMRYVSVQLGIGGWQTFDAAYVEKNKYGDCKALSNFMKAMLKEAGITSYASLIYADRKNRISISPDFAFPNFANHVVLNVPSEDLWLECTSSDYPVNYLGDHNQGRPALLITEKGGIIKYTPTYDFDLYYESTEARIQIDDKGAAIIQQESHYSGPKHEVLRSLSNNRSPQELEEYFLEHVDLPAFSIEFLQVKNSPSLPESTMDFHATVPRYASKAGRRIFVPLNQLNPFDRVPKMLEERKYPVHIKDQYREEDIYTFELPPDYELESIPLTEMDLKTDFGLYKLIIKMENNRLIYHRLLEIHAVELPADRYQDLREFYKAIAKADAMKAVLVQKKA